ncbi:type IV pilus assembly protein PilN [Bacillus ectoiniformans]|uniref:fimbrial assembly protein n=1 Tax=Bacillus ectoiniformans TaxID=1494429 RepID=UPI00195D0F26|nr:fimbrial assembly protein [Bacillus ectoiniformans]MBM7648942.1 type IV pilus assembly protein PilN [Bacillus ectoiniformans]
MLIDINLLPEKERKRFPLFSIILIGLLIILTAIGAFLMYHTKQNEAELAKSQLKTAVQLRETLEANINQPDTDTEKVDQLNQAIRWADQKKVPTVPILKHLISKLPDRGFFQSLSYTDNFTMTLSIQFDTGRDAAYYLSELKSSKWIESAKMTAMNTSVEEGEEDAKALVEKNNALPRYVADYEIIFVPNVVKTEDPLEAEEEEQP